MADSPKTAALWQLCKESKRRIVSIASNLAAGAIAPDRRYDRTTASFSQAAIHANDYARPILDMRPGQSQVARLIFYEYSL